jgi:hypothetical protein
MVLSQPQKFFRSSGSLDELGEIVCMCRYISSSSFSRTSETIGWGASDLAVGLKSTYMIALAGTHQAASSDCDRASIGPRSHFVMPLCS